MFKQPPLKINCEGLSQKLIADLADRLSMHFESVRTWGDDEIEADNPLGNYRYDTAWEIIDTFGVKAV